MRPRPSYLILGLVAVDAHFQIGMFHYVSNCHCQTNPTYDEVLYAIYANSSMIALADSTVWVSDLNMIIQYRQLIIIPHACNTLNMLSYISLHQKSNGPGNTQTTQITIMLTNTQKHNWNSCGMHHAYKRSYHVAHSITFTDDKPIETTS